MSLEICSLIYPRFQIENLYFSHFPMIQQHLAHIAKANEPEMREQAIAAKEMRD